MTVVDVIYLMVVSVATNNGNSTNAPATNIVDYNSKKVFYLTSNTITTHSKTLFIQGWQKVPKQLNIFFQVPLTQLKLCKLFMGIKNYFLEYD
jgi:hypothetical protein